METPGPFSLAAGNPVSSAYSWHQGLGTGPKSLADSVHSAARHAIPENHGLKHPHFGI
ncbi:hypothetical protein Z946_2024 [Sulfitobacter noctilucicola]|nr:hypothetical protein Z946_2024 [Sulfitobacter noctilucicola]